MFRQILAALSGIAVGIARANVLGEQRNDLLVRCDRRGIEEAAERRKLGEAVITASERLEIRIMDMEDEIAQCRDDLDIHIAKPRHSRGQKQVTAEEVSVEEVLQEVQ